MKQLPLLLLACTVASCAFAQQVDLDRFHYFIRYRNLPHHPLDKNIHTYNITISLPPNADTLFSTDALGDIAGIQGFEKQETEAPVKLYFSATSITPGAASITTQYNDKQEPSGYSMQLPYTIVCTGNAYDAANKRIYSNTTLGTQTTYTTPALPTRAAAETYWQQHADSITTALLVTAVNNAAGTMGMELTYNFGYGTVNSYEHLWILADKQHPEYVSQQSALKTVKDAVVNLEDANNEQFYTQLKPALDYFLSLPRKYNTADKAARKMRYGSFYNTALLYLYLDMPDKAIAAADALISNGYEIGDGESLKKQAIDLQELLRNNKVSTRRTKPAYSKL
ncbi:hypothetical protein [Deminuibacter soli]|uniref:Uncharacterized protein n=1 Tax=Deminuibacter soli TaxID=2291815 RepID=A0A3E1NLQ1_9BACT|nr:hypothetical protein [Deminuibacter soli]RFM28821.1 hypothetical protein DXN05_08585 [Deminuibacter soli]